MLIFPFWLIQIIWFFFFCDYFIFFEFCYASWGCNGISWRKHENSWLKKIWFDWKNLILLLIEDSMQASSIVAKSHFIVIWGIQSISKITIYHKFAKIVSISFWGRGKVYVHSNRSKPHLWDYTGYVVVVVLSEIHGKVSSDSQVFMLELFFSLSVNE